MDSLYSWTCVCVSGLDCCFFFYILSGADRIGWRYFQSNTYIRKWKDKFVAKQKTLKIIVLKEYVTWNFFDLFIEVSDIVYTREGIWSLNANGVVNFNFIFFFISLVYLSGLRVHINFSLYMRIKKEIYQLWYYYIYI